MVFQQQISFDLSILQIRQRTLHLVVNELQIQNQPTLRDLESQKGYYHSLYLCIKNTSKVYLDEFGSANARHLMLVRDIYIHKQCEVLASDTRLKQFQPKNHDPYTPSQSTLKTQEPILRRFVSSSGNIHEV